MLHNATPTLIETTDYFTSGFFDLRPMRSLYIISNTLGTDKSMSVTGEWGMLKKMPVSSEYNRVIYDQTALGMDYFDCSSQALSTLDFKIQDCNGNIANMHRNRVSCFLIFVKVADD